MHGQYRGKSNTKLIINLRYDPLETDSIIADWQDGRDNRYSIIEKLNCYHTPTPVTLRGEDIVRAISNNRNMRCRLVSSRG